MCILSSYAEGIMQSITSAISGGSRAGREAGVGEVGLLEPTFVSILFHFHGGF